MIALFVIATFFVSFTLLLVLRRAGVRRGLLWVVALVGALLAFSGTNVLRGQLPVVQDFLLWRPEFFEGGVFSLVVDEYSWPFAMSLTVLICAAILTDIPFMGMLNAEIWAAYLAIVGVGMIGVLAGNPLTLILAWAFSDLLESVILLTRVQGKPAQQRIIATFSVRSVGLMLIIAAFFNAYKSGQVLTFQAIPMEASVFLLLAASIRLSVFPPHHLSLNKLSMRRGLGTLLRLIPSTTGLVLLVRTARVGVPDPWQAATATVSIGVIIFCALAWIRAENEFDARAYWIWGIGAFVLFSAAYGLPRAGLAWGLGLVYSGALLFFYSVRHRYMILIPILGIIGISSVPLSPSWEGNAVFGATSWLVGVILLVSLSVFLAGYFRHSRTRANDFVEIERWMWLLYPWGFILILGVFYGMGFVDWISSAGGSSLSTQGWWWGIAALSLATLIIVVGRRILTDSPLLSSENRVSIDFHWPQRFVQSGFTALRRFVNLATALVEGDGSILWVVLWFVMLLAFIGRNVVGAGFEY